jgi:hypothetical protein
MFDQIEQMTSSESFLVALDEESRRLVVDFLDLKDFGNLRSTCRAISLAIDDYVVYKSFATRRYPKHLLDVSKYDESWKDLVHDDNLRNTMHGKVFLQGFRFNVSKTLTEANGIFVINSTLKCYAIVWDRMKQEIGLIVSRDGRALLPLGPCTVKHSSGYKSVYLKALNDRGQRNMFAQIQSHRLRWMNSKAKLGGYDSQLNSLNTERIMVLAMSEESFMNSNWMSAFNRFFGVSNASSVPTSLIQFFFKHVPSSNIKSEFLRDCVSIDTADSVIKAQERAVIQSTLEMVGVRRNGINFLSVMMGADQSTRGRGNPFP